ncbi:TetR/AcrR family transcriptional regulator [Jannaschia seohaensis]|uniref:AcrR family transcriptional regulator n=1 Tax=Jannaschia seohaensis TaxID=475081 RepID=A0A2Y9BVZ6_9RHOB|nr:TetR/AcrR family transcriptional regulator [Jannaschia seohaensis]PWJ21924.1 AcrR family transcriptional regulator [Jannaschia seohaensis]SSA38202.1 DNA-binding transcriptional regulator, AcrR family [Jannaschia seohaensis]
MARPRAHDHDAKRAAILKGAARVFAREGIARASMSGVARECGVSKANLYHYHDSKDALLFAILDGYLSSLRDRLCDLPLPADPRGALLALTTEALLAYEGMDDEHRIQTEGMAVLPPAQAGVLKGYQRDMVARMADVLRRAAPALEGQRLREAVMSVFGMLNWFYMWSPGADAAARHAYARTVTDLALGGVGALGTSCGDEGA